MPATYSTSTAALSAGTWSVVNSAPVWYIVEPIAGHWPSGYRPASIDVTLDATDPPTEAYNIQVFDTSDAIIGSYSGTAPMGVTTHTITISFTSYDIGYVLVGGSKGEFLAGPSGAITVTQGIVHAFWKDLVNDVQTYS